MGRRRVLKQTGVYAVRLPIDVLSQIFAEDIPRDYLATAVQRAVLESSDDLPWLKSRLESLDEEARVVRGRIVELGELKERDDFQRQAAPVIELLIREHGKRTVRDMALARSQSTLAMWLATEACRRLLNQQAVTSPQVVNHLLAHPP